MYWHLSYPLLALVFSKGGVWWTLKSEQNPALFFCLHFSFAFLACCYSLSLCSVSLLTFLLCSSALSVQSSYSKSASCCWSGKSVCLCFWRQLTCWSLTPVVFTFSSPLPLSCQMISGWYIVSLFSLVSLFLRRVLPCTLRRWDATGVNQTQQSSDLHLLPVLPMLCPAHLTAENVLCGAGLKQ